MISELIIKNYRSINELQLRLGSLNYFIGPNNAGKSNIMKALNLCLGDVYPSVRSFSDKDFHNYNKSNPIVIEVKFDSPLNSNPNVFGFRLSFDDINHELEYVAIDSSGNVVTYQRGREVRVSNEMKDEVALMYLGLDRQAEDQIRPNQWTLYGKLLRHIEKNIDDLKKQNFKTGVQSSYDSHISSELIQLENIMKINVKQQTGLDLNLRLSILDPIETIKNLRPYLRDQSLSFDFDVQDVGAGTQSAVAIAIARAYTEIVKESLIMAIEEPELYLHPHGCRHFYKILKDLSTGGVQVICTTHERCFVDVSNYQNIHLVRKENGISIVRSGINQIIPSISGLSLSTKFDEEINEVFFANSVVLVEGPSDKIACHIALERLGVDLDQQCISIVECGSNTNIKPIGEVLKLFQIPSFVLTDEDPSNITSQNVIAQLKIIMGHNNVLLQSPNLEGLFRLATKPNQMEALNIFPTWFSQNPVPPVYVDLKNKMGQ